MTGPFSARRRADEFEALLSRGADASLTDRDAETYAGLLAVVSDLRALPEVAARPEFVGSLRERLMVEADTVLVPRPAVQQRLALPQRARARDRRLAVVLGGAALAGAAATMAVASQSALPGESLYSVKRGIESAEVRLAGDDAARGRAQLANAETRLAELEALTGGDGSSADTVLADTLDDFTRQSGDGVRTLLTAHAQTGDDQDVQAARDFTATSIERLDALQARVPEGARDELLAAGRTLTDLDLEASIACPGCGGGVTRTPDFLLSSAPQDLLTGLDTDELTLEAAPLSGQDLTGITVPEALQTPGVLPTPQPSSSQSPTALPTATPTSVPTKQSEGPVKDTTNGVKDDVKHTTDQVVDTTNQVTSTLDGLTGGAVGGLTGDLDDATDGLIGEVTGTLDGLTGGSVTGSTGGLLP